MKKGIFERKVRYCKICGKDITYQYTEVQFRKFKYANYCKGNCQLIAEEGLFHIKIINRRVHPELLKKHLRRKCSCGNLIANDYTNIASIIIAKMCKVCAKASKNRSQASYRRLYDSNKKELLKAKRIKKLKRVHIVKIMRKPAGDNLINLLNEILNGDVICIK